VISRADSFKAQEIACKLSELGAVAIVGPGSFETSGVVESIADKLEIPHLTYHYKPKQINWKKNFVPKMTLNFYPDAEALAKAFMSVFQDYDWKKYAIVYENDENLIKLKDILQVHQPNAEYPVLVRQFDPASSS
jgi:Receptor family ligand binding region